MILWGTSTLEYTMEKHSRTMNFFLCLTLDSATKEKLKNTGVERNKNGDVDIAVRISAIQDIVF